MSRCYLPLNALRAFEASARHLSFTRAGLELGVTQAAISQQVRALEARLGCELFRRVPRGLQVTDEGQALFPVLHDAFGRMEAVLRQFDSGTFREVLTVGVVGTFAIGWLMPRLARFRETHPLIELRLHTHNNSVDVAAEGLDFAIRFGEGRWPGQHVLRLFDAPLTVLCARHIAAQLAAPRDLAGQTLLRSYRSDEWSRWFAVAGVEPYPMHGPIFDSSRLMAEAAMLGEGVALAPSCMFAAELASGALVRPFDVEVDTGAYWLTWLTAKVPTPAMQRFGEWLQAESAASVPVGVTSEAS